ncbi:LysO family transporter [Clostridium ganghwense]|uniref:LysO family transporter n=1 Tax=Clostridium ganghwense TaxID=312089 RepID=A0ABT4CSF6_9CLOT|nr:LysO family transporter [Clostridium ganghwense]MCY6372006.1 LysO family transporter [Clostridium ganghwense]
MWTIIIVLLIGVVLGRLNVIPEKLLKYNSKLQNVGVVILLFAMGVTIGGNKKIIHNIKNIGFKSFSYAVFTSLSCIILVYLFSHFFMKGDGE